MLSNPVFTNYPTFRCYTSWDAESFFKKTPWLGLRANYADRATAAYCLSYCQLLRIEGVAWSVQRIPTVVNLGFLDRENVFKQTKNK
jgi:hypothetical protein